MKNLTLLFILINIIWDHFDLLVYLPTDLSIKQFFLTHNHVWTYLMKPTHFTSLDVEPVYHNVFIRIIQQISFLNFELFLTYGVISILFEQIKKSLGKRLFIVWTYLK